MSDINWIDRLLDKLDNKCLPLFKELLRSRIINDQVEQLVGLRQQVVNIQPKDAYIILCDNCKNHLKDILKEIIIEKEVDDKVKKILREK